MDPAQRLNRVCNALSDGRTDEARDLVRREYPHVPVVAAARRYSKYECVQVFARDGYVDRYSGQRLVFPGTLRLLSLLLPDVLPFHPNWKMEACHPMWWDLYPTIDHIVPVARGGEDAAPNWVCTSMLRNAAKSNWTLAELGWELLPSGDYAAWDGLTGWCLNKVSERPDLAKADAALRQWCRASRGTA